MAVKCLAYAALYTLAAAILSSPDTHAVSWTDGGDDHLWNTGGNWNTCFVPVISEDVFITYGVNGPIVDSGVSASANIVRIGGTNTTETLTVTGGSLVSGSHFILGEGTGSICSLDISGGIVEAYSVWVGNNGDGILNMSGGELHVSGEPLYVSRFGGSGHIQLDGGIIHTDAFIMFDETASMDINGGILEINGDVQNKVKGYISNGWIKAYAGAGIVNVSLMDSRTIVDGSVVSSPYAYNPEPADGSSVYHTEAALSWQSGVEAVSHDVYFGVSYDDVNHAQRPLAEINGDGQVNLADFRILIAHWLKIIDDPGCSCDIDGDGRVDINDFVAMSRDWMRNSDYKGNYAVSEYVPDQTLEQGRTYYWRVDELSDTGISKGQVWSFVQSFIPQNVSELWGDFDANAEPLETEYYRDWSENINGVEIRIKLVRYVVSTWKGVKSKMAAYFAYPAGGENLPALLHLHGGGQSASGAGLFEIRNHAPRGYAVMSINWGGLDMSEVVNTDWGAIDPTQTYPGRYLSLLPYPETIDTAESPRNCSWYPIVVAARRGLTFIEQQPQVDPDRIGVFGHSMGGTITTYVAGTGDSRVKAASPSVGGSGYRTYEAYDLGPKTARYVSGSLDLFRLTMDTANYAPNIQCPILFLGATNDFNAKMDDVYRTYALITQSRPQRLTFAPHLNHRFTDSSDICRYFWFDQHLKATFTFPEKPVSSISLSQADNIPLFEVIPDASQTVISVDLYYSQDKDAISRFWRRGKSVQQGGKWAAKCPLNPTVDNLFNYLFAFANVTYQAPDGTLYSISSDLHVVSDAMLADAGIVKTDYASLEIDDFSNGFHDWAQFGTELWTRKITDPKWHGPSGSQMRLRIKTGISQNYTVTLKENSWRSYRGPRAVYTYTFNVPGSSDFQDVILDMDYFSGLTRWDWIDEFGITPTPEFEELSWIMP
jgi:dienelactone hydrolase